MFQVLDHARLVYSGELSQATQYIIEHYGKKLDEAISAGIKIAYSNPFHGMNQSTPTPGTGRDFW